MLFLVIISAWQIISVLGSCNPEECENSLLYKELRCKPTFLKKTDCCPTHYDCSHIEIEAQIKDRCHFHGKLYKQGEKINDTDLDTCQAGCICRNMGKDLGFTCASVDCPEWIGVSADLGCHFKYTLDECCNVGQVCPPFKHTCIASGKVYYVGQKMPHPYDKCSSCVCTEYSRFGECKKRTCVEEIRNRKNIENFCAPSFLLNSPCCPWSWICPEETDNIVASKTPSPHPELKCKYGKSELNIGDTFERVDKDFGGTDVCECRTPPLLTCIHNFPPSPSVGMWN